MIKQWEVILLCETAKISVLFSNYFANSFTAIAVMLNSQLRRYIRIYFKLLNNLKSYQH